MGSSELSMQIAGFLILAAPDLHLNYSAVKDAVSLWLQGVFSWKSKAPQRTESNQGAVAQAIAVALASNPGIESFDLKSTDKTTIIKATFRHKR